jgi:hypothetical protein
MPAPARGREEQGGLSREAALARLDAVDLPFAQKARPIAGSMLQFPGVTRAGVSVRAAGPKPGRSDLRLVAAESLRSVEILSSWLPWWHALLLPQQCAINWFPTVPGETAQSHVEWSTAVARRRELADHAAGVWIKVSRAENPNAGIYRTSLAPLASAYVDDRRAVASAIARGFRGGFLCENDSGEGLVAPAENRPYRISRLKRIGRVASKTRE